jgi:hypothetical protein
MRCVNSRPDRGVREASTCAARAGVARVAFRVSRVYFLVHGGLKAYDTVLESFYVTILLHLRTMGIRRRLAGRVGARRVGLRATTTSGRARVVPIVVRSSFARSFGRVLRCRGFFRRL